MPWDPEKYHQFQKERTAPFEDLVKLIEVRPGLEVVDLGCGTGELTSELAARLPGSRVLGIDSSTEMLERALPKATSNLRFEQAPIENLQGSWDLVFSNAALQWIPDHARLIPRIFSLVRPGGQMVIQVPSNHQHATHILIQETALEQPFDSALDGWSRKSPVLSIDMYAELLYQAGGRDLIVFEKVYPHLLNDADALVDWTSGTALVPYFEHLGPGLKEAFLKRYRYRLRQRYPGSPVFYGFRRTLFSAHRPAAG